MLTGWLEARAPGWAAVPFLPAPGHLLGGLWRSLSRGSLRFSWALLLFLSFPKLCLFSYLKTVFIILFV